MKIQKISYNRNINNINKRNQVKESAIKYSEIGSKDISLIFKNYLGRDLVSFGARSFNETVNKNWYQLPSQYSPDGFQLEAGKALNEGKDVLVEAPTGTGKTAIAHYAVSRNMDEGKTTFYTTPLKALSNQKLDEFRSVYGDENVGILTGDRRENIDAPIIIMTTEVYRNMALSNMYGSENPMMSNLGTVIFDELHYLGDDSRGPVWEESIMLTPKNVQILGLSATIGNPKELRDWQSTLKDDKIELVSIPASARAVPLKFDSIYTGSYQAEGDFINKKIQKTGKAPENSDDYRSPKPKLSDFKMVVDQLKTNDHLPAILFIFSRKFSRELLEYFSKNGVDLTTDAEKQEIEKIVAKHASKGYIGAGLDKDALKKGYAIHNAGIIPAQKKLIEELFQKKLTKVVIATETLAAGINMPAKTVVISSPYKPTDSKESEEQQAVRTLTANEFKQMSGRAGRRGIDTVGYVYTMPVDRKTEQDFLYLEVVDSNPLERKYSPDYSFLSGYYEHNSDDTNLEEFLSKSFYAYSSDELERDEKTEELIDISAKKRDILLKRGFLTEDNGRIAPTVKGSMAAQVKGYDALTLVEAIASKKFENITPETLAMIAGAIANPSNDKDDAITLDTDFRYIFENSNDSIESVYKEIHALVADKLKKLGRDINSFGSYDQMLEFLMNLQDSGISEDESLKRLKEASERRAKMYAITKLTGKMSAVDVVNALKKGEIVPTKVLETKLEELNHYKNRIHVRTIEEQIERLNRELEANMGSNKGKKAKARLDKKCAEIKKEIETAQVMQYLDNNLVNVIASNYRFIQKNPPHQVREEYAHAEQEWIKVTSKDLIISQIEALKEIKEYRSEHDIQSEGYKNLDDSSKCIKELQNDAFSIHQTELESGISNIPERYGKIGAQVMYNWALLNRVNPYSMLNWEKLLRIISEDTMDEGSIYRSILQTSDLLGQMVEMADAGVKNSDSIEDMEYYSKLRATASEARKLLIKYPVEV